ncbi:MAG: MarR family transcriptional regulator [Chlorobi bacterium]|nr:MarR family transcriptional regulator [Chlorobiota bacterium]
MSSKIKKDPRISKQQRMVIDIFHTSNYLDDKMSKVLKTFGITHPQFNIVKNLQAAYPEAMSVKEIKETIMFKNSDVTRLLDRLVNKGLLERNTCPVNRRQVDIKITDKGSKLIDSIMDRFNDTMDNFFEDIVTKEEALRTSEILRRLRE